MKITSTYQQMNQEPELPKDDAADNLAGMKKSVQKSGSKDTVAQSAAIKSDTVQLSQKSIALASAAKSDSGDNVTETENVIFSYPSISLQEILSDEFNYTESLESAIDHFGQYNVILA